MLFGNSPALEVAVFYCRLCVIENDKTTKMYSNTFSRMTRGRQTFLLYVAPSVARFPFIKFIRVVFGK